MKLNRYAAVWLYTSDIEVLRVQNSGQHVAVERVVIAKHGGQMVVRIIAADRRRPNGGGSRRCCGSCACRSSTASICACVMIISKEII